MTTGISGTPCVVIWETVEDSRISYVGFDNHEASYSITEYPATLGHRRIGIVWKRR